MNEWGRTEEVALAGAFGRLFLTLENGPEPGGVFVIGEGDGVLLVLFEVQAF
jgi:hypothetical protein